MALEFKKFDSGNNLGTVSANCKDLAFNDVNLANPSKRVVVVLSNDEGTEQVTCSRTISDQVRTALSNGKTVEQVKTALLALPIIEAPNGGNYIGSEGTRLVFHSVAALTAAAQGKPITLEELAAMEAAV